ncbi:hypothetical protein [Emergencia timonensis]|uniref:hypothetical protein n=1 Tax=Emergencia timonensis TaxID=1776384 RepID=UPI003992D196
MWIKYPAVTLGPLGPKQVSVLTPKYGAGMGMERLSGGERVQQVEISYNCVGVIELPGINKTA